MSKLLPCPFCGNLLMFVMRVSVEDEGFFAIECRHTSGRILDDNHAESFIGVHADSKAAAIVAWNTRANDPRITALIEAISQLKDGIDERDYVPGRNVTPIWNNDLDAVFAAADAMETVPDQTHTERPER